MSCLICCCACALYMFHRGRVGNVFIDSFVCLTCKEIDNKATLTLTLTAGGGTSVLHWSRRCTSPPIPKTSSLWELQLPAGQQWSSTRVKTSCSTKTVHVFPFMNITDCFVCPLCQLTMTVMINVWVAMIFTRGMRFWDTAILMNVQKLENVVDGM